MGLLEDARRRAAEMQAAGQPLPISQGAYVPQQFGGASDEGLWTQPVWDSNAGLPVQQPAPTVKPPPQLAQQAPGVADFANRQSPELAQLQAVMGQMQQPNQQTQPPAMRGMMQNGLFAGASGGLPAQARRTPGLNPVQLMQMLSQTGLMGGAGGGVQ